MSKRESKNAHSYTVRIEGTYEYVVTLKAMDFDSAVRAAIEKADRHMRDDGELVNYYVTRKPE